MIKLLVATAGGRLDVTDTEPSPERPGARRQVPRVPQEGFKILSAQIGAHGRREA